MKPWRAGRGPIRVQSHLVRDQFPAVQVGIGKAPYLTLIKANQLGLLQQPRSLP
ncbi:hypothetical protein ACFV16_38280 [Streptomyces massasporeus]|uniref:hypothetical protein n=1 Tax=Streptomyces massasporeus TaxID=67324 RepID=UPI0036BD9BB2